jgi:ribonuclease HII
MKKSDATKKTFVKIGIDEAGRGPWFGPVVAGAFAFDPGRRPSDKDLHGLTDSKALTEARREKWYAKLVGWAGGDAPKAYFGVGVADNFLIDEIGIKKANREAMRRAVVELMRKLPKNYTVESVVIDGNDGFQFVEETGHEAVSIIRGDAKVAEISAASVLAKVFRDKLVTQYASLYPEHGIDSHKGYGTSAHQTVLKGVSKVTGGHRLSFAPIRKILERKPKLLLHVCCGPDATVPVADLKKEYDLFCYWYDPNIQPKKEYDKRLAAFKKVCEIEEVPFAEGEYDTARFLATIKGLESTPEKGEKCARCYDMRLERAARYAAENGFTHFATTLAMSPHKELPILFESGNRHAATHKLEFLKTAFRKNGGFDRSVEYTKTHGIYRQTYCGCAFSETFPGKEGASEETFRG